MACWRNGSAFDSRSKGYPFKSGAGHLFWKLILLLQDMLLVNTNNL